MAYISFLWHAFRQIGKKKIGVEKNVHKIIQKNGKKKKYEKKHKMNMNMKNIENVSITKFFFLFFFVIL